MGTKLIAEAINNLNAIICRLIFAFECDRGLELGRNCYYKKDEAHRDNFRLMDGEPVGDFEEDIQDFITSKASKAQRKAFFQKQIELLEAN